uniref:MFS transporter n=1 Tax=uncultured Sphingomonas sp. TaxID=158754 RepID=UPI0035CAE64D
MTTETDTCLTHATRPRLRWSDRATLAAAILVPGLLGAVQGLGNFLVLPLMTEFAAPRGTVIFLIEIGTLGMYLTIAAVGRLLTFVAPWIIMLVGALIAGASLLGLSDAPTLGLAATGFIVAQSLGLGLCGLIASQTIVVRRAPERQGVVSGAQTVALALTGVALPLIVAPQIVEAGWRATVAWCGIGELIVLPVLILAFLRVAPAAASEPMAATAETAVPDGDAIPTTFEILGNPAFWILMLAIIPIAILAQALAVNIIPFYAERGVSLEQASYVLAGVGAGAAVGAIAVGFIVDRVHPAVVMAAVAGIAVIGMTLLSLQIVPPAPIFVIMMGSLAGVAPTLNVAVRRYFGKAGYAPVVGLVGPFLMLSAFSGAGTGWLRDVLGSYHNAFWVLTLFVAVSFLSSLLLVTRPIRVK